MQHSRLLDGRRGFVNDWIFFAALLKIALVQISLAEFNQDISPKMAGKNPSRGLSMATKYYRQFTPRGAQEIVSRVQFPPQWSEIQDLFDSIDGLYPESDMEASAARDALFSKAEGDILLVETSDEVSQAAVKDVGFRWPGYPGNGTIPYVIDDSLSSITDIINKAMEQYHNKTCIRFVNRTTEKDYLQLFYGIGCSSYVGRIGGKQDVNLGSGCEYVGTVVHELGHAVGLYHEHQRSDRDEYIKIFPKNVKKGYKSNFKITDASEELIFSKFNEYSIMIYGEFAFSRDPDNLRTMKALNMNITLKDPFTKPGLTNKDIETIKKLYECN